MLNIYNDTAVCLCGMRETMRTRNSVMMTKIQHEATTAFLFHDALSTIMSKQNVLLILT